MSLLADLQSMSPRSRIAFVKVHVKELETLTESELTAVGTLLCHASSIDMRETYPIIGDYKPSVQEEFEVSVFGDEDSGITGTYVTLPDLTEDDEDD